MHLNVSPSTVLNAKPLQRVATKNTVSPSIMYNIGTFAWVPPRDAPNLLNELTLEPR